MSYETRRRWTGQGTTMCPLERRSRFGPIQPMQHSGSWRELVARMLRRVK